MDQLEQALLAIKERNERVEMQKAWETSPTRRFFIALVTYLTAYIFMRFMLGSSQPYFDAMVPTGGYLLSTFSLPVLRECWMKKYQERKGTQ